MDIPVFTEGFKRSQEKIELPTNLNDLRQVNLQDYAINPPKTQPYFFAIDSNNKITGGLYLPQNVNILLLAETNTQILRIQLQIPGPRLGYRTVIYDFEFNYAKETTTIRNRTDNTTVATFNSLPNGTIYVDGNINWLGGTVQKNSKLTIGAKGDIAITDHILYEENPQRIANTKNILAVLSENGNVILPYHPLESLNIYATLIALKGAVRLACIPNPISFSPPTITVYGGIIQKHFGFLGEPEFCSSYFRGFRQHIIHDPRVSNANTAPLGIPKANNLTWQANREDGTNTLDLIVWKNR